MGPMGNVETGGQRGTGDIGHMANEAHSGYGVQGMGHMGNRGTGGMGFKGCGPHGQ